MEVKRADSLALSKGPAEYFTGDVSVKSLVNCDEPSRLVAAAVTFSPGARTAWHTHPLGQTLVVTDGLGVVQSWGAQAQIIKPGDVIWTPPGEKHWHGALPGSAMTHIAILEKLNGKNVDWMEQVQEDEYQSGCALCQNQ